MKKICMLGIVAALATTPALAIKRDVIKTLSEIPTQDGGNVFARMKNCRIKINNESWVDTIVLDNERTGDKKGDIVVWVFFDAPPPPDWGKEGASTFKSLNAGWRKRDGKFEPTTGWAKDFQFKPYPLNWLNC